MRWRLLLEKHHGGVNDDQLKYATKNYKGLCKNYI